MITAARNKRYQKNILYLTLSMNLKSQAIEIYPLMAAARTPASSIVPAPLRKSPNLRMMAPKMTGALIRKEKRAALTRSSPRNKPEVMVAPDLEIPGIIAAA